MGTNQYQLGSLMAASTAPPNGRGAAFLPQPMPRDQRSVPPLDCL